MEKKEGKHTNMKTLKIKNPTSLVDKSKMWNLFDTEINPTEPLECIYRASGDRDFCDTCDFILCFSEEGFLTCTNPKCGIIYKDIVDKSAEWRYYGADDNHNSDPTRCGMPINPFLQESSYGCTVLAGYGGKVTWEMRKIQRFTRWHSIPYSEKSKYDEFQKISTIAQNSGLPKIIVDDAIKYHTRISEFEQTFRGDNKDGLLLASIYISCRINKYPRTAKELATIFNVDVSCATKGCKIAQVILNDLEKNMPKEEKTNFEKTTPESFIQRYCSRLGINQELTKLCEFISIKIETQNLMPENTPHSIAAGVVYFVSQICQLNVTKQQVRQVSEISEVTINKCFKKMEKIKDTLIPSAILSRYSV
jgi:transcription initiation factor TFIIB